MVKRTFLVYFLLELAAAVALLWTIGLGWTLLLLLATSSAGVALAGSQVRRQIGRLQELRGNPQGAVADGMLVALGTVLVFVPGIVSTMAGALMLLPPTRKAVRPVAARVLNRTLLREVPVVTVAPGDYRIDDTRIDDAQSSAGFTGFPGVGRGDYIDGEVLDEQVIGRVRDVNIVRNA